MSLQPIIPFYSSERMGIFIDGANLYAAARALEFDIDYRLLLQWAAKQGRLVRAFYYTAISEDQDYSPIRLARLQWVYAGDKADQGIYRCQRA